MRLVHQLHRIALSTCINEFALNWKIYTKTLLLASVPSAKQALPTFKSFLSPPISILRHSSEFSNFLWFSQPQGLSYILALFLQYSNYAGLTGIMLNVS